MAFYKYSADKIFDGKGGILENMCIVTDKNDTILSVEPLPATKDDILFVKGWICPGFVNTHCHLELSHMKGKVDTGTGLLPFLMQVVGFRDIPIENILEAIQKADAEMYKNGIVAVGDISNKADSSFTKNKSLLRYYTFVEMFDFLQPQLAQKTFDQYIEVYHTFSENNKDKKSCVPHAPYTVSNTLYSLLNVANQNGKTVSIHNQETTDENELFLSKSGGFVEFFRNFGFSLEHFSPLPKTSIHHALSHLNPHHKTLFVHNTLSTEEDISAAQQWSEKVFWATCPNANLYIENRLPAYKNFLNQNAKMTIGTDSLTSNWQLSIWEEIKTIHKYTSYVPFSSLITWATYNGAAALGFDDSLGSIEKGKSPGLVALENIKENPDKVDLSLSSSRRLQM
ncbi:MAG: amidohydrolase family protein [Saprospiraceae bacterium]|nr:amidohydrolase family protein [Saprospiraceae bacterium]